MVTSLPFPLRLLLTIGLFLPINYVSLQNYQIVLTSHVPKKIILSLSTGWFLLTVFTTFILPENLIYFLILLTPGAFAYFFKKYDHSLDYFKSLMIMLFLNFFHLAAFFIGDIFSYYLALLTNNSLFIYFGLLINLLLVYSMWLLLKKTNLAKFIRESFTDSASRRLGISFNLSLILIWIGFITYYFKPFEQESQFTLSTLESKSTLTIFITGLILALSFLMVSLMYLKLIRSKLVLKETLVEQQNAYLFLLKEVQQDIDYFRTNTQTVLPSIQNQLENGQIATTKSLLSEQLASLEESTSLNFQQLNALRFIQNIELKTLLIATIFKLKKKAIPFYLDIKETVPSLLMTSQDTLNFSRLILLNIYQAVSPEPDSSVSLKVTRLKNIITFTITYSCKEPPTEEQNLDYRKIIAKYEHIVNNSGPIVENYQYVFALDLSQI